MYKRIFLKAIKWKVNVCSHDKSRKVHGKSNDGDEGSLSQLNLSTTLIENYYKQIN